MPEFFAYVHSRPDGRPFYVGKGLRRRALCLSPSRRSEHHQRICRKYGRDKIRIELIPAPSEADAFEMECLLIATIRERGFRLCNLTDGGEGCSGPRPEAVIDGLNRGRDNRWRGTQYRLSLPAGPVHKECAGCSSRFESASSRAVYCSEMCAQRARRRAAAPAKVRLYSNNKTGHAGVFAKPDGKFIANIGVGGKLVHLGTFPNLDAAVIARKAAEDKYAPQWNGGKGL